MGNKKMLLAVFFVLLAVLLLVSGCGTSEPERQTTSRPASTAEEPSDYRDVMAEAERQMDEAADEAGAAPSAGEGSTGKSCMVLQQCGSGDDLCWNGRCWTEAQLWDEYEKCQNMKCDHLDCPECESGHEQCTMATSAGSSMYQVCVDCVQGRGCKAGFTCKMGRCV